ncbi:unnamed protein product [Medioppia subpectinata]|uniref:Solute carrier family 25 member 32 n=1 Tax=Medioppia subpectinata TaxID=1979941 RepID=A0A7R9KNK1_9ACAR|nr:unnamed protein product [Medioppia subpectinata]CAG2106901.1 unnamed protein product [Medioppia subpectinata]
MSANNSIAINTGVVSTTTKLLPRVQYEHMVAGVAGGVAPTLILHPFDLVKIRLAVNDGQLAVRPRYDGLVNTVATIVRQEGVTGLYRGVTPNCVGAGAAWGLYFLFYNTIKSHMTAARGSDASGGGLGAGRHMLAAAMAGCVTTTLTNPIWVVKTQMCLQYGTVTPAGLPTAQPSNGMLNVLTNIYRREGVVGLYRGYLPGILNVSHGALQFMAYEELKRFYTEYYELSANEKLDTGAYLCCAALSKLFAVTITYPQQLLRARLQDQHSSYKGLLDVIKRTWRYEGVRGYYKGLLPNLIKVTPACALTFVVYEHSINFLLNK